MGICSASKNIWGSGPRYPNNCAKTGITGEIWQSTCSAPCALRVVRSMCLAIQHNHIVSAWIFGDFMGQVTRYAVMDWVHVRVSNQIC